MSRRKQYRPVRLQEEDDKINDDIKSGVSCTKADTTVLEQIRGKTGETSVLRQNSKSKNNNNNSKSNDCHSTNNNSTSSSNCILPKDLVDKNIKSISQLQQSAPLPPTKLPPLLMLKQHKQQQQETTMTLNVLLPLNKLIENRIVFNENAVSKAEELQTSNTILNDTEEMNEDISISSNVMRAESPSNDNNKDELKLQEKAMQELALIQSTFFALQQQQMIQMKLLQELQSQMDTDSEPDNQEIINGEAPGRDVEQVIRESKITMDLKNQETMKKEVRTSEPIISPSLAESIIINNDDSEHHVNSELSSLEILQKRTQEVLENATQSLNNGSLTEELAYRREQNGSEPHFKHRCRYCGKIFGSDSALQIHLRSHTGERPFKCDMCSSSFTTKGNLKVHYQRHTTPDYCPLPVPGLSDRMQLSSKDENLSVLPNANSGSIRFSFPLGFPGLPFSFSRPPPEFLERLRIDVLNNVQLTKTNYGQLRQDVRECDIKCKEEVKHLEYSENVSPKLLDDVSSIKRIRLEKGNSEEREKLKEKNNTLQEMESKETCSQMEAHNKLFESKPSIDYNLILPKFGSKDRSWEKFIEVTKTSETSKLQQLVDNIENKMQDPNECPICHKVLSCRSALFMHYRIHTGEKPFRCKICGRPFTTKGNLKVHMSIHRVKEPFAGFNACPICHQKFSNIFSLQDHIRAHTEGMIPNERFSESSYDGTEIEEQDTDCSMSSTCIDEESRNGSEEILDLAKPQIEKNIGNDTLVKDVEKIDTETNDKSCFIKYSMDTQAPTHPNEKTTSWESYDEPVIFKNENTRFSDSKVAESNKNNKDNTLCKRTNEVSALIDPASNKESTPSSPQRTITTNIISFKDTQSHTSNSNASDLNSISKLQLSQPFASVLIKDSINVNNTTTNNQKHYCRVCKRNFSSSSALQIHTRTHTGDRPFVCHVCSKSFTTKGNLKVHMGTHMWTNTASRRGRRMSLDLPLTRPLNVSQQDGEFLQHRSDLFYPYLPPQFINGMTKVCDFLPKPPIPMLHPQLAQGKFPFPAFAVPINFNSKSLDGKRSRSESPIESTNGRSISSEEMNMKTDDNSNSSVEDLSTAKKNNNI